MSSSQVTIFLKSFRDVAELMTGLGSTGRLRAKFRCNNAGNFETTALKFILPWVSRDRA